VQISYRAYTSYYWENELNCFRLAYLVVDAEGLIRVLYKLMDRKSSVVGLDNSVRDLRGWHNRECGHHAIGKLLADLGDQEGTHPRACATTEGVCDLEALEAVTGFSLTTDDINDLVNQLSTFGVVSLGPVVTSTRLTEDEVVGTEKLAERPRTDSVHSARLKVDEDGTRNIFVPAGLPAD
jgi:hypothetical protein